MTQARANIGFTLAGPPTLPGRAYFQFDSADPFAVRVTFFPGEHNEVEWLFARDLLDVRTGDQRGEADVIVAGAGERIYVDLMSPEGRATVMFEAARIRSFLDLCDATLMPGGADAAVADALDAWLADVLGKAAR